jgi:coenzyme PQQ synthesis protein D (PqqD)
MSGAVPDLALETVIARRPDPLTAPVDDELVMLDTRKSVYFGLDRIGRRIWDLLDQPRPIGALCKTLEGEFDVSPETCRDDVLAFVGQMAEAGLVEVR